MLEFLKLTSRKIESLSRDRTVFFFPVGPVEDHGPHLPVGLDLFEAEKLSQAAAEKLEKEMPDWTGVVMPSAPLGIDSDTTGLAITVRAHVLRDWLVDAAVSLRRSGFRHFACFTGHLGPRQLTAIEEAGKLIARRNLFGLAGKSSFVSLSSALVSPREVRASPLWPDAPEHGGKKDTSVALYVTPELVEAIAKTLPAVEREPSHLARAAKRWTGKTVGYWGNPKDSSSVEGKREIESIIEKIWPRLRGRLDGVFAPSAFRSWYSVIPSNRSFFKSWLLALAIFLMLGLWASLYLHGYS